VPPLPQEDEHLTRSLWSRILLAVSAVVFITTMSFYFLAAREMEKVVTRAEEQHARDLIDAVMLSVETEYESLLFHRAATLERRKTELKNIVTLAMSHIDGPYQKYRKGLLSESEAQQEAMQTIGRLRYDEGVGYLWINDLGRPVPRMIMNPTQPELDGRVMDDPAYNTTRGSGKNLFVAAVDLFRENGEGFVDYLWPKPTAGGLSLEQPKLSYVRLFREWGWVLGTGVYIDDIGNEDQRRLAAIIEELSKTFAKVRIAETGYMFVFNGKKEILIHPTIARGKFDTLMNPMTGTPIADSLIEASRTPEQSIDYIWDKPDSRGEYRFPKRAFVTYFEPLDWYIGATLYTDELAQPGIRLRERSAYLATLFLAATFLVSVPLARGMTKPLLQLTQSARAIEAKGLAAAEIPIGGTAETRELGAVLKRMVGSLKKAEEKLRGANRELEAFTYTVSHDLRSPLTPIIGFAQVLQERHKGRLDEESLDCLAEIEKQGDKMLSQMEDLLALAQVGHLERPARPVDTNEVVREVAEDLRDQIAEAEMEVKLQTLPAIHVPASLLAQLFANLIGNAIRYAGRQGNPIEAGGEHLNDRVRLFVRDHGPGIPEAERQGIFDLFYRGSTSKKVAGTGIGLAIVQKVARTYGGQAWVEETPGGGSTFWVEIKDAGPLHGSESDE